MKTIKNYTSSVPVDRTISTIESELVEIGASRIIKTYGENKLANGIIFEVSTGSANSGYLSIKIPVNIDGVLIELKTVPQYKRKNTDWLLQQAQRTGWRIILDWVLVQCAMIRLKQADALEVFLPYEYSEKTGNTFYKNIKHNGNYNLLLSDK